MEGEPIPVTVQVCGRRETVNVRTLNARELSTAVETIFDVRPPFVFANLQGHRFEDDDALAGYVKNCANNPIMVRLAEGVLYDFSRRADQIRHLQWGFLSDQLASTRQEKQNRDCDIKKFRALAEEEKCSRQAGDANLQRGLDAVHELLARERRQREEQALEGDQLTEEQLAKLRKGLESILELIRKEREDAQLLVIAEANRREEDVIRLRHEITELREALSTEESQRREADDHLHHGIEQTSLIPTSEGWTVNLQNLASTVRDFEGSLNEVKSEMRRVHGELGNRASEEHKTRIQSSQEISHQLDDLRRSLERETQERKLVDASVEHLNQELARQGEAEAKNRQIDVERLVNLISDEVQKRQETNVKWNDVLNSVSDESRHGLRQRERELADLHAHFNDLRVQLNTECVQWKSNRDEFEKKHEMFSESVETLRDNCKESMQREMRSRVERERSLRGDLETRIADLRSDMKTPTDNVEGDTPTEHLFARTARPSIYSAARRSSAVGSATSEVLLQHSARLLQWKTSGSCSSPRTPGTPSVNIDASPKFST